MSFPGSSLLLKLLCFLDSFPYFKETKILQLWQNSHSPSLCEVNKIYVHKGGFLKKKERKRKKGKREGEREGGKEGRKAGKPEERKRETSGRSASVAHAIEHLLCKCKALSSNPSPTKKKKKKKTKRQVPVAHACNSSYSRGKDQEDQVSKPAWANSSRDPIWKIPVTKKGWWSGSRYRP
jgi:hypothetical protein